MRLHGDVEFLYPSRILIRPFAQLRFLLRLHHEWLWVADAEEPAIFKVVAYLVITPTPSPTLRHYLKFLVDEGSYRYILSGSLLGVELKNVCSVPVGYLTEAQMHPIDFEEFLWANGTQTDVISHIRDSFANRNSPDSVVHAKMMRCHSLYLITGGMPAVVQKYIDTNDLRKVVSEQEAIIREYKRDITQYDGRLKMRLHHIYDVMPSELNKHNKRFFLKNATSRGRIDRSESDFVWLAEAGVAIPVYNVDEPKAALELAKKANLFKFFMNDVGLLCSMYANGIQMKILNGETDINF